jgi:hypothetical protein
MARFRPLTIVVLTLALASGVLTLTLHNPRADELRLLGIRVPALLTAQIVGTVALILLGLDFLRRPPLRTVGWVVLALAAATAAVLAETIVRFALR